MRGFRLYQGVIHSRLKQNQYRTEYFLRLSMCLIIIGVLQQIDLDVIQCEAFAASKPIKGLEEGILLMCFSDLRQLLDLFVAWDWATYLGKEHAIKK